MFDTALKLKVYTYAVLALFAASAIACVLGFGLGAWAGVEWQQGRQAQRETASLAADLAAAQLAVQSAQRATTQISRDVEAASSRLNQHAKGLSDDFDRNRRSAKAASTLLEDALARNRDMAAVVVDADVVQAWNRANAGDPAGGAGADRAATGDHQSHADAMSGAAAAGARADDRRARP